jgi:mRNA-degrading endonuclease RelE of RelBE toxin-antitoxin system
MQDYTLKIHNEALDDIQQATDWYNEQKDELGKRFQMQVVRQINKLKNTAPLYNIRYQDVRCLIIKKFPFMVHYTVNQKLGIITIYAVVHTSRHPKIWSKR